MSATTEQYCPVCNHLLEWQDGGYFCKPCDQLYQKKAYCPTCEEQVDKLQACGSVSYFCNHCNELKSKSSVRIEFEIQ